MVAKRRNDGGHISLYTLRIVFFHREYCEFKNILFLTTDRFIIVALTAEIIPGIIMNWMPTKKEERKTKKILHK
jgi:hypothetical protein